MLAADGWCILQSAELELSCCMKTQLPVALHFQDRNDNLIIRKRPKFGGSTNVLNLSR